MSSSTPSPESTSPVEPLRSLVGNWKGIAQVFFEPTKPVDDSPMQARITTRQEGSFLQIEYTGGFQGKALEGMFLVGWSKPEQQWMITWLDSFHNGTRIMSCLGEAGASPEILSATGDYPANASVRWGWRIELLKPKNQDDPFKIMHYNIPAGEEESIGIVMHLTRV